MQSFKLRKIQVFRNGDSLPTGQGITVNDDDAALLYTMTLDSINRPEAIPFNLFDYRNGYYIMCFDLTNDRSSAGSNYKNPCQQGTVRILLDYEEPLKEAVSLFCVSAEDSVLHLDAERNPRWL
jgi:hypothetical protein